MIQQRYLFWCQLRRQTKSNRKLIVTNVRTWNVGNSYAIKLSERNISCKKGICEKLLTLYGMYILDYKCPL